MSLYSRVFARYYDRFQADYEEYIVPHKRELFEGAAGTFLELGPGTGANLRYLPAGCRWIGIEPNRHMHASLRERAEEAGILPEIHPAGLPGIGLADSAVDVVISTLVLCSVPNVKNVLTELRRVLKPGGRFLFIEHVAATRGTGLRFLQSILGPAWRILGDGCRINREIGMAIEEAGFSSVKIRSLRVPSPPAPRWVSPHIIGQAVR
jgi:SAM-dependent methyltransferase